jgi:hypothetical protein
MGRARWMEQGGRRIFVVDFSDTDLAGVKAAIAEGKPVIAAQPPFSVLCLVDCSGTKFSLEISDQVKEFAMHNKPYIKMTAIIGVVGIAKVVLNTTIAFTKRDNLILKDSLQEALDFLSAT